MIKALSATAIVSLLAAAVTFLPGLAPQVQASGAHAKGDRLDIRPVGRDCSEQAWPHFETGCLRRVGAGTGAKSEAKTGAKTAVMVQARIVTTDRH